MTPQENTVVSGTVRDSRGRAVAEARVLFVDGPVAFADIAALTDNDGKFSLSAPAAGTYKLECFAEGFAPATALVTVPTGAETLHIELKE